MLYLQFVKDILATYYQVLVETSKEDLSRVWKVETTPSDSDLELLTHLCLFELFYPERKRGKLLFDNVD